MTEENKPKTKKKKPDPLHGITLEKILTDLVHDMGWEEMSYHVKINCFTVDPSIKSSLTFLRRTDWARKKVERLYLKRLRFKKSKKT